MSNELQVIEQPNAIVIREELDIAITTAKAYPRNIESVLNEVYAYISSDKEIARAMWYSIPRAGATIEGESIRLAEVFLSCWGNLRVQGRVKEITNEYVIAEALVFDLEKNIAVIKEARRRIVNKDGVRYSDDMIQQTAQACISIALRNALFTVIPRAFIKRAVQYAKEIFLKFPDEKKKTPKERFNEAIKFFVKYKLTKEQLLEHLQKSEDAIDEEDIVYLQGLFNSLRDGEIKPVDVIDNKRNKE